ncbi:MAG TPA: hypothetical protein VGD91_19415 [Trebonia sp.]
MSVKLASQLPKGTANGVGPIVGELCRDPDHLQVVIAIVDCKEVTTDTDTGDVIPTMRIRRIEAVTGTDKSAVRRILRRAMERRTGRVELPFEVEQDLAGAFGEEV